jgi:hypothetical protein
MQQFKVFLSPQVAVPDDVLQAMSARLKKYFDAICRTMSPRKFSDTVVKLSPHANEVGDVDLLGYITQASLIVTLFNSVFEPGIEHSLEGTPGGGTKKLPSGTVLSECFFTGGIMELKKADAQGITLANLIFHEFAHNKHTSDPLALSKNEFPRGDFVHDEKACGGGIFAKGLTFRRAANLDLTQDNIRAMARVLGSANKQETCGLFSDELGF